MHEPGFQVRYFVGHGLDVGGGYDGLDQYRYLFPAIKSVRNWDLADGDAQYLTGIPDESFDFVHSSHCLEHMVDAFAALHTWWHVIRPGGYLVLLVPDEDLYEQGIWPSTFSGDHKHTFTIWKDQSWSPVSLNLIDLIQTLPHARILKMQLLDQTFCYGAKRIDQSTNLVGECAIECVLWKELESPAARVLPPGRNAGAAGRV